MTENIGKLSKDAFRLKLLSEASAVSLSIALLWIAPLKAEESEGRPQVWVEIGGQLDGLDNSQAAYLPPFSSQINDDLIASPAGVQEPAHFASGFEGSLLFKPGASHWKFEASIKFGRSNTKRSYNKTTHMPVAYQDIINYYSNLRYHVPLNPLASPVSHYLYTNHTSYAILDFSAGKDVGFGVFGRSGSTTISAGVRFAQFNAHSDVDIAAIPNADWAYRTINVPGIVFVKQPKQAWNVFHAQENSVQSFNGIGPSVGLSSSEPLLGREESLSIEWGMNGGVIFGRQKAQIHRKTSDLYDHGYAAGGSVYRPVPVYDTIRPVISRDRLVAIPNVGASAGFTLRFPNAKIAVGYRADFFFGAIDGGIDTRKSFDRNFYGPFATISVGLGG